MLSTYALVGFVLLLFRQRSDRTVMAWVLVLVVVVPLVVPAIERFGPILLHGTQAAAEAAKASEEHAAPLRARFLAGLSSDSLWTTQRENARYFLTAMLFQLNRLLWMVSILGRFLLGLLAGRHLLMQDVERNLPLHRKLLGWGLVLGVLGNGAWVVVQRLRIAKWVALTLAVFVLQVPFSHWWLSRFRFGPAEWLWRSLTYGRAQPMRLAPRSAADSAAG